MCLDLQCSHARSCALKRSATLQERQCSLLTEVLIGCCDKSWAVLRVPSRISPEPAGLLLDAMESALGRGDPARATD